ncbi:MAG: ATP-binding protein [Treponema sp.]|nr:ATP-binding protein [Treponema sp.]
MPESRIIHRPDYFASLERHRLSPDLIKIVTGVRRCGKSTLLRMYQDKLRCEGVKDDQILAVNLEDFANKDLLDGAKLHEFVEAHTVKDRPNYVFLDEIQLVSDFGGVINSLRLRENIDLYVTGSNSSLLSGRLPKILGGRYIQIHMFPLSFREYASVFPEPGNSHADLVFQHYLEYSSFPEAFKYLAQWDRQGVREYLSHIYESIIMRDVMQRDDVKELPQLTRVVSFLFSNIGSETSVNNMVGVINNEFRLKPTSKPLYAPMLEKYLEALLDCFVFYRADRQHLNGKELLRTNAKYYAVDVGLRYHLLGGTAGTDAGHVLENVVYLELLRRGYKVKVGRINDKEIDFVAWKPGDRFEYYQVAQSVDDENTLARELAPLRAIKDNYPKFLLTRGYDCDTYNGIQHLNVLDWLLGNLPR